MMFMSSVATTVVANVDDNENNARTRTRMEPSRCRRPVVGPRNRMRDGQEGGRVEQKRDGESCNNKWRSISPTLLKTVGRVLTARRWASHDAWRHHRGSFNAGIFFTPFLHSLPVIFQQTFAPPLPSPPYEIGSCQLFTAGYDVEFDGSRENSLKANQFWKRARLQDPPTEIIRIFARFLDSRQELRDFLRFVWIRICSLKNSAGKKRRII